MIHIDYVAMNHIYYENNEIHIRNLNKKSEFQ